MANEINENKLSKVFNDALDVIDYVLKNKGGDELTPKDIQRIKSAQVVMTSYPRYIHARASTAHVALEILHGAAENEEQYRNFVRQHVPYSGIMKTVPTELLTNRKNLLEVIDEKQTVEERYLAEKNAWNEEKAELLFKVNQLEHKL
jgi:hypothetical protein